MSYMRQMQLLADEFYRETGRVSATKNEMARWAIGTGQWNRHEEVALKQCEEDFANALRVEYETDPKGRRIRSKYAATLVRDGKKVTEWGTENTSAESLQKSH
jgi:peroxiredoxin